MPDLNRIRICNIKYNDGNNYYDDFLIKLGGKNTYMDLINGVGKTFYMQCINQPILPNSKFDEKKTINLLFNEKNKNKVFHSIMEFRLDQGSAYKYAMVGICAYAKENNHFEEKDNRTGPKFNMLKYICLYNEPNEFDIENFPLSQLNENNKKSIISEKRLEKILKDLKNRSNFDYAVIINETNSKHYEELAKLNINEVEFYEMIQLNKFEGNSANYLKDYKKGKDFILNSLIPIIEKSYKLRNSDDYETSEARANTLITLRDTLRELQKKEALQRMYEYVENELINIIPKIEILLNSFVEKDKLIYTLSEYNKIILYNKNLNEENKIKASESMNEIEKTLINKKNISKELYKEKDAYKIKEAKTKLNSLEEEHNAAFKLHKRKAKDIKELEDKKLRYECEMEYRTYLELKEKLNVKKEEIKALAKDNESILAEYDYWGCYYKNTLIEEVNKKKEKHIDEKERYDKLIKRKLNLAGEISSLNEKIISSNKLYHSNLDKVLTLDNDIKDIKKGIYHLLKEDILQELNKNNEVLNEKQKESIKLKDTLEEKKANIISFENEIKLKKQYIDSNRSRLNELSKEIDKYNNELINYNLIEGKYDNQEESILKYLDNIINNIQENLRELNVKNSGLSIKINNLENETVVSLSDSAMEQFDIILAKYSSAILGSSFLESKSLDERKTLLDITELIPYSIIVDEYDFNKIIKDTSLRRKFNDEVVPIINSEVLQGKGNVGIENVTFTIRDKGCFVDPDFNEKLLINLRKEIEGSNIKIDSLNSDLNNIKNDYKFCSDFKTKYNQEDYKEKEEIKKRIEKEIDDTSNVREEYKVKIEDIKKEIEEGKSKLVELDKLVDNITKVSEDLEAELADYKILEKLSQDRKEIESDIVANKSILEELNEELLKKNQESENIDKQASEVSKKQDGLFEDFILVDDELKKIEFTPINEVSIFKHNLPLNEIRNNFKLYQKSVEGNVDSLKNLQETIIEVNNSIEKIVKKVESKNKSNNGIKYVISYFFDKKLFEGNYNAYLEELDETIIDNKIKLEELNKFKETAKSKVDKLEGEINSLCERFKSSHNGIKYEDMNLPESDIKGRLDEIDINLNFVRDEIDKLEKSKEEINTLKDKLEEEFKTLMEYQGILNRVMDRNNLQICDVIIKDYTKDLDGINNIESKVSTAMDVLKRNKQNYESALNVIIANLEDSELVHFKEDLETLKQSILDNKEDCETIISRLQGENGYIESLNEEMERISSIINELKQDEETFIDQLLQKCEQVYSELLNITHLSKININGKSTSMIEVIVKPADEVIRKARMKTYINQLVNSLRIIDESKRKSYLADNLKLKDLFSQFVENINKCDVKIYKVDAIASNSKPISWEEVIGSTGQSNGMAYNIFICLMSFIKKLYNPYIGDESRKFVMFDAPFSGMAASYIWEPIIKLLDENNFQVLCLGYEMPSNLLPLFDVKYYLGTNVSSSGMQTVVVKKLKSEIDLDLLSYKKLVGNQISMIE